MIRFRKVTKRFGQKLVLDAIDFTIRDGEIVFVMGKSGTGKSVLLKNIVGLLRPDSGEIWVDDTEVSHLAETDYYEVRKKCGMVFQFPALLDSLTVFDNVAFGLRAHRMVEEGESLRVKVEEKLRVVGLGSEILLRFPPELSFGLQKRVSIARTLAVDPGTLLFDEPTTGMDPVGTNAINHLIQDLSRRLNVTSVVVSHDMHCALDIADRIFLLDGGSVLVDGTPQEILRSHEPLVEQFVRAAREHHSKI